MSLNQVKNKYEITSFDYEETIPDQHHDCTPKMFIPAEHVEIAQKLAGTYNELGLSHNPMNHQILRLFVENISNGNFSIKSCV